MQRIKENENEYIKEVFPLFKGISDINFLDKVNKLFIIIGFFSKNQVQ